MVVQRTYSQTAGDKLPAGAVIERHSADKSKKRYHRKCLLCGTTQKHMTYERARYAAWTHAEEYPCTT